MSRYIDRDKFIGNLATDHWGVTNMINVGIALDKSIADVVEVVRCKDCVARPQNYLEPFACARNNILVYGNSFCSYGKRREENEG